MPILIWSAVSGIAGVASGWFASGETADITQNLSKTADKTATLIKWLVLLGVVYLLIKNADVIKGIIK